MNIDFKLLRNAVALADHESFSLAARELGISQPALSRSIQRLEASLESSLFIRSRKGVRPTVSGELLLARARDLLARADGLERELGRLKGLARTTYLLGAGPFAARLLLGSAVGRLSEELPELGIEIRIGQYDELVRALRRKEIDMAVVESSGLDQVPEFEIEQLTPIQGHFVVRAGHPLAPRSDLRIGDVLACPFVMSGRIPPRILDPLLEGLPANESVPLDRPDHLQRPFPAIDCPSPSLIVDIAARSDAVGATTLSAAEHDLRTGRVKLLSLRPPWLRTSFAIVRHRDGCGSEIQERVRGAILEADRELVERERRLFQELIGAGSPGNGSSPVTPSS